MRIGGRPSTDAELGWDGLAMAALLATTVPLLVGAHGVATLLSTCAASFCGGGFINLLHRRWAADGGMGAYSSALKNKGGGPRVPTYGKTKICRLSALIDLAGVSCSRRLRRQTLLSDSCLEIYCWIGWNSVVRTRVFV
jgi:hypothetical protein